jgi:hypothetical protein
MNLIGTFLNLLCLFSIAYFGFRRWGNASRQLYWVALGFHLTMGMAVGLIYFYYYEQNDTWTYFKDATQLAALAKNNLSAYFSALTDADSAINNYVSIYNTEWRSVFFVKILSLLSLISHNNYWICCSYISLVSFFACWHIHQIVCEWCPQASYTSAFSFLFFPSIIFWSSGIQKESLALSGIYFSTAFLLQFWMSKKASVASWMLLLASLFFVWKLRYFWLAVFLLVSVPTVVAMYLHKKDAPRWKMILLSILVLAVVPFLVNMIHPNFAPEIFLDILFNNNQALVAISNPDNLIHYYHLEPTWLSLAINSPWALVSGLFRPFVWESQNFLSFLASLENLLLLLFTIASISNARKTFKSESAMLIVSTLIYVFVLCTFLALSTPNFGSLSRYRIGFLPFFVFLITYQNPLLVWAHQMFHSKPRQ